MKKNKISNKHGQEGQADESHNTSLRREGVSSDVFTDPRQQRERRIRRQLDLVPDIGCRRRQRRRNRAYINDEDWWTKRSYNDGE